MTAKERYDIKHKQFLNNEITFDQWVDFCNYILDDLLQEEEETLKRLKEN